MVADARNDASLCPAVQRIIELLEEKPREFDIAILSDKASENLENAIVLQDGSFLGVNALDLPRLARDVRRDYWQCRNNEGNLCNITKCLLLLCPDHATAWADRRRYLLRSNDQQQALREELAFINLLMTKHTKAPSSWSHRKWVVDRLLRQGNESDRSIREELELCTMVAERYPKNYYAWTHRLYCMRKAEPTLLNEEWEFVLAWIPRHVSDHSAVHYGGQAMLRMMQVNNRLEMIELVEHGMQEGKRLVQVHPAHEVLWIFRRVCAHTMLLLLEDAGSDEAVQERFVQHLKEEWNEAQQSQRPKVGSELELEWRKTHVYRLSYFAWVTSQRRLDDSTRQQAIQALIECDFIPHNMWHLKSTGLS